MSLFTKIPLLLSDESKLADLITALPFSAHVRNVENGKFTLANDYQAKNWGFQSSSEILGQTTKGLYTNRSKKLSDLSASQMQLEQNMKLFEEANHVVERQGKAISFQESTLISTGFVFLGKIFKWPLPNYNGKTIAVFTIFKSKTQRDPL